MRHLMLWVTAGWSALVAPAMASGFAPEVVHRGENATALLQRAGDLPTRSLGSAFCVGSGGTFVTSARAARGTEGSAVQLVLAAGNGDPRKLDAKVVRLRHAVRANRAWDQPPVPALLSVD